MAKYVSPTIAVIGCGSIGTRHLENLHKLGVKGIIACDPNQTRLDAITHTLKDVAAVNDYQDLLKSSQRVDAAIIAAPTHLHVPIALECAKHGIHLFIEKPLSHSLDNIDTLLALVKKKKLVGMMGMCYRFHIVYRQLKALLDKRTIGAIYSVDMTGGHYLPSWHPHEDYRKEYSARKEMGGGVILTSGIHSFDIIRWLFGEIQELKCIAGKIGNLPIDVEDSMECIMQSKQGAMIRLHLDFVRKQQEHRIAIVGEKGMLEADIVRQTLSLWQEETKKWERKKYRTPVNDMYEKEMRHFLISVKQKRAPMIDIEEGRKSLMLTLRAKKSAKL